VLLLGQHHDAQEPQSLLQPHPLLPALAPVVLLPLLLLSLERFQELARLQALQLPLPLQLALPLPLLLLLQQLLRLLLSHLVLLVVVVVVAQAAGAVAALLHPWLPTVQD
jgi:hypothetical protein